MIMNRKSYGEQKESPGGEIIEVFFTGLMYGGGSQGAGLSPSSLRLVRKFVAAG